MIELFARFSEVPLTAFHSVGMVGCHSGKEIVKPENTGPNIRTRAK